MMKTIAFIIFILVDTVLTTEPTSPKTKRSLFEPSSWPSYSNPPDYGNLQAWPSDENQWKNLQIGHETLQANEGWTNLEVTATASPTPSPVVVSKQIVLERKVPVFKPVVIERKVPVPVEKIIRVPYEKIVNKAVAVPVPQPIPYPVERPIQVPVRQTIAVPVRQPYAVPVRQGVPYPVPVPVLLTPQGLMPVPGFMLPALQNSLRNVLNDLQNLYQPNLQQLNNLQNLYQDNLPHNLPNNLPQNNLQPNIQNSLQQNFPNNLEHNLQQNRQNNLQRDLQNNLHNDIQNLRNNLQNDLQNLQNNIHNSLENNNVQNDPFLPSFPPLPLQQSNGGLGQGYHGAQGFQDINDLGLVPPPAQDDSLVQPAQQVQGEPLSLDSPPIPRDSWFRPSSPPSLISPLLKWKRSNGERQQYRETHDYEPEE